jgi:hypothetical protein
VPIVNVTDISRDHVAEAIARMEMDIQTVARSHRGLSSGYMKLLRELQSLDAENAALRADKERLDWLESVAKDLICTGDGLGVTIGVASNFQDYATNAATFRAAIDAARKEQP